ncbi:MAG: response regulator transcription factor [Janthinobacterium lividum]
MTAASLEEVTSALADDAPHLLLVDDDRRIRELLSRVLGKNGYRVTLAATAAEARIHLRSFAFDLLILDVMMPGETGVAFAADVRRTSEVPILMLTALDQADDRVRGLEAGADDYLAKPYEPRELLLRIASILRRAAPRQPKPDGIARFGPFSFYPERGELR